MPKVSGCAVDFCAGLHEPDSQYHAAEVELHPLDDGSTFTILIRRDDRTSPERTTIEFKALKEPDAGNTLADDLVQGIRELGDATLALPVR